MKNTAVAPRLRGHWMYVPIVILAVMANGTPLHAQTAPPPPNIWTGRDISIPATPGVPKVVIGIWDSGVDTTLFSAQLARDSNGRALIRGYDAFKQRQDMPMRVMPQAMLSRRDELNAVIGALDDLDTDVDSPAARALEVRMKAMSGPVRDSLGDEMDTWSGYIHGTPVADAALNGNGQAVLMVARMEWWHGTPPVPCWTRELADREAASIRDLLQFQVDNGARVVNMSWGRYERSYLSNLEQCAAHLPLEERQGIARYSVETIREVLRVGMTSAPHVLFVGAAGNEGVSVEKSNPATRFNASNFLLVGALQLDGSKTSFSNSGPEVTLYANGFRVPGRLPGGTAAFGTGTSMAAPLVTNAAAKMVAVNPRLTGAELRHLLEQTADTNSVGLRMLHPARAVAAARAKGANK